MFWKHLVCTSTIGAKAYIADCSLSPITSTIIESSRPVGYGALQHINSSSQKSNAFISSSVLEQLAWLF